MESTSTQLENLQALRAEFGVRAARDKLQLLAELEHKPLPRAAAVERLHEWLCFARAWPDNPKLLTTVSRMLKHFDARKDLKRFAAKLANTGIVGTDIRFQFYFVTAKWLAEHFGESLHIDWQEFAASEQLPAYLESLVLYGEAAAVEQFVYEPREWLDQMRSDTETDAVFLIKRFDALRAAGALREKLYQSLDPTLHLSAGENTPARTLEYSRPKQVHYQTRGIDRGTVDLVKAADRRLRFEPARYQQAIRLINLARGAMVSRQRDLDAFAYASADDVAVVHCSGGIKIVLFGMLPEKRYLLECEYGYLMLKNGVVIGYGTGTGLFGSCQIAFNLFPTFRGAETAEIYACVLATFRQLFLADTFAVDCYQIGADNEEAIESGAWWFYARLGFRPRDVAVSAVVKEELRRAQQKGYRSSKSTLRRLANYPLYFSLARKRQDVLGTVCTDSASLRVLEYVSERFGSEREAGMQRCSQELADALGVDGVSAWPPGEQLMWNRLSPLIAAMGGVAAWSNKDRDALVDVIRAKGGTHEAQYLTLFDAHRRLRRSVARFARAME